MVEETDLTPVEDSDLPQIMAAVIIQHFLTTSFIDVRKVDNCDCIDNLNFEFIMFTFYLSLGCQI